MNTDYKDWAQGPIGGEVVDRALYLALEHDPAVTLPGIESLWPDLSPNRRLAVICQLLPQASCYRLRNRFFSRFDPEGEHYLESLWIAHEWRPGPPTVSPAYSGPGASRVGSLFARARIALADSESDALQIFDDCVTLSFEQGCFCTAWMAQSLTFTGYGLTNTDWLSHGTARQNIHVLFSLQRRAEDGDDPAVQHVLDSDAPWTYRAVVFYYWLHGYIQRKQWEKARHLLLYGCRFGFGPGGATAPVAGRFSPYWLRVRGEFFRHARTRRREFFAFLNRVYPDW